MRYGAYNYLTGVPEAACALDIAGAIAWMTQIATFVQQLGPQRCHRTWLAWLGIPEHCRKFLRKSSNYCWGIFQPCFTGGNQVTSWISQRCWEHLRKPPIFGVRTMVSSLDFQLLSSDPHCYHLNPGSSSVFQVPVFVMAATNVYIYILCNTCIHLTNFSNVSLLLINTFLYIYKLQKYVGTHLQPLLWIETPNFYSCHIFCLCNARSFV